MLVHFFNTLKAYVLSLRLVLNTHYTTIIILFIFIFFFVNISILFKCLA